MDTPTYSDLTTHRHECAPDGHDATHIHPTTNPHILADGNRCAAHCDRSTYADTATFINIHAAAHRHTRTHLNRRATDGNGATNLDTPIHCNCTTHLDTTTYIYDIYTNPSPHPHPAAHC